MVRIGAIGCIAVMLLINWIATVIAGVFVLGIFVWLGNLNIIAPILTMFFLTTYGVLNVSAGVERFLGSPSFRPQFKVHWSLSLLGAVGCAAVMFLINWVATVVAAVCVLGIFLWLERRGMEAAWGDVRRGIWMAITRAGLLRLRAPKEGPGAKNWRPHILVLSGAPTRRWHLIDLASSIAHNKALMTVATVLPGGQPAERVQTLAANIHDYLGKRAIQALVRVITAPNHYVGAERLVESYGLGALVPNTVLLGTNEEPELRQRYCGMIARFHAEQRNVVVVREGNGDEFGDRERIDVWWGGLKGNGGLMMILAYLLSTSLSWRGARVNLKMVVADEGAAEDAQANIEAIVARTRTGAVPDVIAADGREFDAILREESSDADLVMMGLQEPGEDFADYYTRLMERTAGMPTIMYVLAAEPIPFGEVLE
ncbi:MAG: hypothetical protein R3326_07960 [Gemmatimonadota bacterium]|nr:hypothetical protein [Gemmatimonadota bacterium]